MSLFVALLLAAATTLSQERLSLKAVAGRTVASKSLIVGRAVCGRSTFLLTDGRELIAIAHESFSVSVRELKGGQAADHPWGLACLSDGSLWTLATPRSLVRIDRDGSVRDRMPLQIPRIVMYGWNDRLLVTELPVSIGKPLLLAVSPRAGAPRANWPRFVTREFDGRTDVLAHNLINCGIGDARVLPCWFADDRNIVLSDGIAATTVSATALLGRQAGAQTRIWDVALSDSGGLWVLATASGRNAEGTAGGHLVHGTRAGVAGASVVLTPAARTIVAASDTSCVLLMVDGRLVEVNAQ